MHLCSSDMVPTARCAPQNESGVAPGSRPPPACGGSWRGFPVPHAARRAVQSSRKPCAAPNNAVILSPSCDAAPHSPTTSARIPSPRRRRRIPLMCFLSSPSCDAAPHHPHLSSRADAPGQPSPVCESAPAAATPRMLRRGILHPYACHLSTPYRLPRSSRGPNGARRALQSSSNQLAVPHHQHLLSRGRASRCGAPPSPSAHHRACPDALRPESLP